MRPGRVSGGGFLQPGGVDQPDQPAAQHRLGLLAVARHARGVGHQRRPPPASRLNSVDLPTFGRPAMTTTGSITVLTLENCYDLKLTTDNCNCAAPSAAQSACRRRRRQRPCRRPPPEPSRRRPTVPAVRGSCRCTGLTDSAFALVPATIRRSAGQHRAEPRDRVLLLVRVFPARQLVTQATRPSSRLIAAICWSRVTRNIQSPATQG